MIMENQNISLDKTLEIIKNIQYLDFNSLDIFDIDITRKLLENENNSKYKESAVFLQQFMFFSPDTFNQKHREFVKTMKLISYIDALYSILEFLPKGTLKAKIASVILIESQNRNINKPEIAKIVVENFIYDFDKIFNQDYTQENNIFFAIDLGYKFQLFDKLNIAIKIKQIFNKRLDNTIDFKFTRLYQILTNRFYIWDKDEHLKILHRLYKIATKRIEELKTIMNNIPQARDEKNIICNILETILFIINEIKKDKKCKYIQRNLYNKIIRINLEFSDIACNTDNRVALEALQYALNIAHKQNNKELITNINKRMQSLQQKILKIMKPISIPLSSKQQDFIAKYKEYLDNLLTDKNKNLFTIFMNAYCFKVDFDSLNSGSFIAFFFPIIEYDSDYLISNIHEGQDGIFMDYRNCIIWYSYLCYILKTKLLQKFYPQKKLFILLSVIAILFQKDTRN